MAATKIATALGRGPGATTDVVAALKRGVGAEAPSLLMAFSSIDHPLEGVAGALATAFPGSALLSCTTAGEFSEEGDTKGGVAAIAVAGDFKVFSGIGTGQRAQPEAAVQRALEGLPRTVNGYPHCTAVMLLDPLAGNGEEVTLIAGALLGDHVPLAGGAAGDDLKMTRTLVGSGTQVASDAVALALIFSRVPLGVGLCHGHQPLSGPLTVTRSEGNEVFEIDGRPAWEVWREQTRTRASAHGFDLEALPGDREGAFLLTFEAGLSAGQEDYKIRAPLSRSGTGGLAFACGIPQGTVIRITESVAGRQVDSAREAARRARQQLGAPAAGAVVFDCICRNLILGKQFGDAVRGMSEELGGVPLAGFETYGEIALDVGAMSGFHNTTSVVLAFPT